MNQSDIAALMKGIAPAIRDLVARAVKPMADRVADLEAKVAAADEARTASVQLIAELERRLDEATRKPEPPSAEEVEARALQIAQAVSEASQKSIDAILASLPKPEPLPDIPALVQEEVAKAMDVAGEEHRAALEAAVAAIPEPKDGTSVSIEDVLPAIEERLPAIVSEAVAAIPIPKDGEPGKDADPAEVERLVTETVERVLSGWERPQDGKSVTVEDVAPLIEDQVAKAVAALPPAEPGKEGPPGKLPVAKAWSDGVTYEAEVRTHNGALWQAIRDTGKEPGENDDWICLAAAGEKGKDADEIEVRGTYDPEAEYKRLNIVALNGGAFIARKDNPGLCPGEDWQQIAMRGKPGEKGLRGAKGEKGDPGDPGPGVLHLAVNDMGLFTLVNGDGSTIDCDLYPLLSKLGA